MEIEKEKVRGVLKCMVLQCVKDMRKFLGLANYYRHFVKNFAKCYDSPWTGLLTSGDAGCHGWTAMGVSSDTSGKVLMMDTDMGTSV